MAGHFNPTDRISGGLVQRGLPSFRHLVLEQGRIRERGLVRRLAARKFGAETAERLTRVLEDMADADRIDKVVDVIVDCDPGSCIG